MSDMVLVIRTDVATARPPKVHASMFTTLAVDYKPGLSDDASHFLAVLDAKETAYHMAMSHPHVVMVVGQAVDDVLAI